MPIDPSGHFTRLYNFQQDRDDDIRILASRMDGEFDNVAEALNTPTPSTAITYNGQELSTVFDDIYDRLNTGVLAEDVPFGDTNVSAALIALQQLVNNNYTALNARLTAQETRVYTSDEISYRDGDSVQDALDDIYVRLDTPPFSEGYWNNGADIHQEGEWSATGSIVSEGVWAP